MNQLYIGNERVLYSRKPYYRIQKELQQDLSREKKAEKRRKWNKRRRGTRLKKPPLSELEESGRLKGNNYVIFGELRDSENEKRRPEE